MKGRLTHPPKPGRIGGTFGDTPKEPVGTVFENVGSGMVVWVGAEEEGFDEFKERIKRELKNRLFRREEVKQAIALGQIVNIDHNHGQFQIMDKDGSVVADWRSAAYTNKDMNPSLSELLELDLEGVPSSSPAGTQHEGMTDATQPGSDAAHDLNALASNLGLTYKAGTNERPIFVA